MSFGSRSPMKVEESFTKKSKRNKRKSDEIEGMESPKKKRKCDEFPMFDESSNDSHFDFSHIKETPQSSQESSSFKTPSIDAPYLDLCLDSETSIQTRFEKDATALSKSFEMLTGCFEMITCQAALDNHIGNPGTILLDCRFDYEYFGGHLVGAIKCETRQDIENVFTKYEHDVEKAFLIHCEFSICRAPRAANYLACLYKFYTGRSPKIYVMKGGYSKFYREHKHDAKSFGIFEIHGYVKESSLIFKCRQARKNSDRAWNEMLLSHHEQDSDDSLFPEE